MSDQDRPTRRLSWRPGWWRVRIVAVVLLVAAAVILFAVFIVSRQTDLAQGTPVPGTDTSATPTVVPTEPTEATPEDATVTWPAGSLPALLALAPDQLDSEETSGLPIQATYANLEGWLASSGLDRAELSDGELLSAIEPLELPEILETRGLSPEWREMYGFDLRQVDQVLAVGHAPNQILIMPGRYDAETLLTTWTEHGYQAVEVEETTVWSLFPGDRIDLSAPASRPALGTMNTVALLDDGTLIATARQSRMSETLQAVRGGDSLLENDLLLEVAESPEYATSPCVVIASGRLLQQPLPSGTAPAAEASPSVAGSPVPDDPEVPPVDLLVFALSPDAADSRSITMTMVYDDAPDDIELLPGLLENRVSDDPEWSTRYRLESIEVVGEESDMVEVRFTVVDENVTGLGLIEERDLEPFFWTSRD